MTDIFFETRAAIRAHRNEHYGPHDPAVRRPAIHKTPDGWAYKIPKKPDTAPEYTATMALEDIQRMLPDHLGVKAIIEGVTRDCEKINECKTKLAA